MLAHCCKTRPQPKQSYASAAETWRAEQTYGLDVLVFLDILCSFGGSVVCEWVVVWAVWWTYDVPVIALNWVTRSESLVESGCGV